MARTANEIIKISDSLKSDRGNWEDHWQTLARHCIPRKAYINRTRTSGERVDPDIYDSTGMNSAQMLAAGLQSFLTNPSQKWFTLGLQDRELSKSKIVKEYLKEAEDKVFDVFNGSNFNQQIFETYLDLGVFGTASLYEEEDEKEIVRFSSRPINEVFVMENKREVVDFVSRRYKLTARQAFDRWGKNAGKNIQEAIDADEMERKFDFIHCVEPRNVRDVNKKDAKNLPFSSTFVNVGQKLKVSEGGFNEFPFYITRFNKVSGEKYGYSPAMIALPDILMVNEIAKTTLVAGQLATRPPLSVPHDGYLLPIRTAPDALNYRNPGLDPREKIEPINIVGNVQVGLEMENQRRTIIERIFFVDLFLQLSQADKVMTATEILERNREKMLMLGPVLGRLMNELLNPLIFRTFFILLRNRLIPDPPEEIQGSELRIEYISVLARAQKTSESRSLDNFVGRVSNIAVTVPNVLDKVDMDKVVDEIAAIEGINPTILRDEKETAVIRQQRAAAVEKQKQAETLQATVQAAKTGAETNKLLKDSEEG